MVCLSIEAPFAVARTFTAGWYRPTAPFLTPSMVYGLLLNLAGIEMRLREEAEDHSGKVPSSVTLSDLPTLRIAMGVPVRNQRAQFPNVQTVFQQLHNYPVGSSGKEHAERTFGSKYNITPVRREFLSDLNAVIACEASKEVCDSIIQAIECGPQSERYGLPFLGDNSFLPDRIDLLPEIPSARWYERIVSDDAGIRDHTARLTTWIDRENSSETRSTLFAPIEVATSTISENAWIELPPSKT